VGLQTGIQQTVIVNSGVAARAKNGVRDELVSELTLSWTAGFRDPAFCTLTRWPALPL